LAWGTAVLSVRVHVPQRPEVRRCQVRNVK
jgi:hypothetical protein